MPDLLAWLPLSSNVTAILSVVALAIIWFGTGFITGKSFQAARNYRVAARRLQQRVATVIDRQRRLAMAAVRVVDTEPMPDYHQKVVVTPELVEALRSGDIPRFALLWGKMGAAPPPYGDWNVLFHVIRASTPIFTETERAMSQAWLDRQGVRLDSDPDIRTTIN